MTSSTAQASPDFAALAAGARRLVDALEARVVGQHEAAEGLVAAYVAGGHALLEGVPGIGKTLLARSFATALGADFRRIQFTPDLMPGDLVGTHVFDAATATFRLVRGPVFTRVLMADEINRTPPKTQSALLEAMQEGQVTLDGTTLALDPAFFVVATQNPIEFEGIYPLPEAQLDRFLLRLRLGLPPVEAEREMLRLAAAGELGAPASSTAAVAGEPLAGAAGTALRGASRTVHVAPELLDYLQALAVRVRASPHLDLGVSPRGVLALLEAGRAAALLEQRAFVVPDDFKRFLDPCWAHRVLLSAESELEGWSASRILQEAASAVPVPR